MNKKLHSLSLLFLLILLFTTACAATAPAPTATPIPPTVTAVPPTATPEPPQDPKILFIGDSYTADFRGLNEHLVALAASKNPPVTVESMKIAPGGTSLWGHWFGPQAVKTIQQGQWTTVVLQDDLEYYEWDEAPFYEYHRNFHQEIQNIGAETVLFLSWKSEWTDPALVEQMTQAYVTISEELGVKVAPVGPAWRRAMTERPDLDLYADDRGHANIAGTYLTTVVIYATIFDESPEGLAYLPSDLIGGESSARYEEWKISEEDLAFLQRIAWETVVDYQENGL